MSSSLKNCFVSKRKREERAEERMEEKGMGEV
jgi:hypothetical protein